MRLPDLHAPVVAALILATVGGGLCFANLYVTAQRSTIPLAISETIVSKEIGREHAEGLDDVHFLWFDQPAADGWHRLHVDREVYDAVEVGQHVEKPRWTTRLMVANQPVPLKLSSEFWGMTRVMPVAVSALLVLVWFVAKPSRTPQEGHPKDRVGTERQIGIL